MDDKLAADFNYVAGVTAFLGNQLKQVSEFILTVQFYCENKH